MTRFPRIMAALLPLFPLSAPCASTTPEDAQPRASTADAHVQVLTPPLALPGLGRSRTLRVHLPDDYDDGGRRYPVIYLQDAQNLFDEATAYAGEWQVDEHMDALRRETGFAAIVVGIDHGGERRLNELAAWPNPAFGEAQGAHYFSDLVQVIKPFIDANYRTLPGRESTAVGGSSFGGIAAQYGLLQHPEVFSRALVFSPSYWVNEAAFEQARSAALDVGLRLHLYMGGAEGEDALEQVRRMHAVLAARGPRLVVQLHIEDEAGHDEAAWRAEFPHAIRWLFDLPATR